MRSTRALRPARRSTPGATPPARAPHSVVALVGSVDLRAVIAVDAGRLLGGDRRTALHVIEPGEDVDDLAARWMRLRCSTVPLRTVDAQPDPLGHGLALAEAVVEAVTPADPEAGVTVVLARLQFARRWHRWLHDQTAERIAAAIEPLPRVEVLWVPVPVPA